MSPRTATTITVTQGDIKIIKYRVTNTSQKIHYLQMTKIKGIHQITTPGNCLSKFKLVPEGFCTLTLQVIASELGTGVSGGPEVCEQGNTQQCYQPSQINSLNVRVGKSNLNLTATPSKVTSLGGNYSQANNANGGATPYVYSLFSGSLPPGTTLNTSTGEVSGTPTTKGPFSYVIQVKDHYDSTATAVSSGTIIASAILTAVGSFYNQFPAVFTSNNANTWSVATSTSNLANNAFESTSCIGSGGSAICTAVGSLTSTISSGTSPSIYYSTNGGGSWSPTASTLASKGILHATSCAGVGMCTAIGESDKSKTLLYYSNDGGQTWSDSGVSVSGAFNSTSCTVSGVLTPCIAAGPNGLLYYSSDKGLTWSVKNQNNVSFSSVSCSGDVCTAVGGDTNTLKPVAFYSPDAGASWFPGTIANLPLTGQFLSTSCAGLVCTAVGASGGTLLLYESLDSGQSWDTVLSGNPSGTFYSTSCTNTAGPIYCSAVGFLTSGVNITPILYNKVGGNWSQVTLTGAGELDSTSCAGIVCTASGKDKSNPILYRNMNMSSGSWALVTTTSDAVGLKSTSCTSTTGSVMCTAVGVAQSAPLLSVSTNSGSTWNLISNISVTATLSFTSCSGSGDSAICTAAGSDGGKAVLYLSQDGGNSWNNSWSSGLNRSGTFTSASCTGTGSEAICSVVGADNSNNVLVYVSQNGGSSWTSVSLLPPSSFFISTSCTGSDASAVCTVAGFTFDQSAGAQFPLVYQGTNKGSSWAPVTISGAGILASTSCTGAQPAATCTTGGIDSVAGTPIFFLSTDSGSTWSPVMLTQGELGTILSTGATGG